LENVVALVLVLEVELELVVVPESPQVASEPAMGDSIDPIHNSKAGLYPPILFGCFTSWAKLNANGSLALIIVVGSDWLFAPVVFLRIKCYGGEKVLGV
jgi:hypothetical protein